jgi:sulfite reductase alpha subunit-like flavoprotein
MTASDWYQDVRHLELEFDEDIQLSLACIKSYRARTNLSTRYFPGDVAVVHPIADPEEVDAFLKFFTWGEHADDHYEIQHTMTGK